MSQARMPEVPGAGSAHSSRSSRRATPVSTGATPRGGKPEEPSPALSTSSLASHTSSASRLASGQEMQTNSAAVKPGVTVSITRPAPKRQQVDADDPKILCETDIQEFLTNMETQLRPIEMELGSMRASCDALQSHCQGVEDHNYLLRSQVSQLEEQVRELTDQAAMKKAGPVGWAGAAMVKTSAGVDLRQDFNNPTSVKQAAVPGLAQDMISKELMAEQNTITMHTNTIPARHTDREAHSRRLETFLIRSQLRGQVACVLLEWAAAVRSARGVAKCKARMTDESNRLKEILELAEKNNLALIEANALLQSRVSELESEAGAKIRLAGNGGVVCQGELQEGSSRDEQSTADEMERLKHQLTEKEQALCEKEEALAVRTAELDALSETLDNLHSKIVSTTAAQPTQLTLDSQARRHPEDLEIASHVAQVRSTLGLELSEGDQSVILANTVENGDHRGQLAQLRARVLHLRKTFRFGWTASHNNWVKTGSDLRHALSSSTPSGQGMGGRLDSPEPGESKHSTSVSSPAFSFMQIDPESPVFPNALADEGLADVEIGRAGRRKKATYRSPGVGKGGLSAVKDKGGKTVVGLRGGKSSGPLTPELTPTLKVQGAAQVSTGAAPAGFLKGHEDIKNIWSLVSEMGQMHVKNDEFAKEVEREFESLLRDLGTIIAAAAEDQSMSAQLTCVPQIDKPASTDSGAPQKSGDIPPKLPQTADMTEQLRSGQHFLPEFLYLEDDQDTQPPAPWKSVSYQPRKKISKDKARVDELCRNANDTYKSYSQVQKVKFDEHPEERIFDLHLKLEMASAQIQRQKQKIELLQRAQGSPTKRKHVANSDRTSHTNPNKNVSRGNPVRLPSIFSGSSKMVSLREGSPTVEKNKFPSRVLFRNLDHRAVQEKGNRIAHQTSSGDEDIKRLRMLWDHTTNLPTGKFKMGPQPLQEGTWPPTAGKGLMKTAVFDKGPHPQGGTPVKLVDVDMLKSTLASLMSLRASSSVESVHSPMAGWSEDDNFLFSQFGGLMSSSSDLNGRVHAQSPSASPSGGSPARSSRSRGGSRGRPGSGSLDLGVILEEPSGDGG